MDLLKTLLQGAGLSYQEIGRIAVTTGPGSFTGIRVGIAAARGLALGLEIPVTGISVLESIAFQHKQAHPDGPLVVAMDAKRNEVFVQVFEGNTKSAPSILPIANIASFIPDGCFKIAGSAARIIVAQTKRDDIHIISHQTAADIDAVAEFATQNQIRREKPKPLYLRQADAKPQPRFAVAHKVAAPTHENGQA